MISDGIVRVDGSREGAVKGLGVSNIGVNVGCMTRSGLDDEVFDDPEEVDEVEEDWDHER